MRVMGLFLSPAAMTLHTVEMLPVKESQHALVERETDHILLQARHQYRYRSRTNCTASKSFKMPSDKNLK